MTTVREKLRGLIAGAVQKAQQQGALPPGAVPEVTVETPQNPEHGDFASNIALKLAKPYRRAPMDIAKAIAARVATTAKSPNSAVPAVGVAPPGLLTIRLPDHTLAANAQDLHPQTTTWRRVRQRKAAWPGCS